MCLFLLSPVVQDGGGRRFAAGFQVFPFLYALSRLLLGDLLVIIPTYVGYAGPADLVSYIGSHSFPLSSSYDDRVMLAVARGEPLTRLRGEDGASLPSRGAPLIFS